MSCKVNSFQTGDFANLDVLKILLIVAPTLEKSFSLNFSACLFRDLMERSSVSTVSFCKNFWYARSKRLRGGSSSSSSVVEVFSTFSSDMIDFVWLEPDLTGDRLTKVTT